MTTQMSLQNLLDSMWKDYCELNPAARKIYDLLTAEGEKVVNDHIALRTFNHPRLGIKSLARKFENLGYKMTETEYHFTEKKLYARHWEHPDSTQPKIFISELELEKTSPFVRETINKLISTVPDSLIESETFSLCGRPWNISYHLYSELAKESEYASWVAAHGFRPNHFTVFINSLKKYNDIFTLNKFLASKGFRLNQSGGEVKGTPAEFLEQSSTMASEVPVKFSDGVFSIPGCYYEFAKRYPMKNGKLYQGFIAASADKIFESTNKL
ncbi:MAG: 2-oxoadipate dioxygenase/decarboxylase family protein [Pseudobdellovibrionaceae bacterium]